MNTTNGNFWLIVTDTKVLKVSQHKHNAEYATLITVDIERLDTHNNQYMFPQTIKINNNAQIHIFNEMLKKNIDFQDIKAFLEL